MGVRQVQRTCATTVESLLQKAIAEELAGNASAAKQLFDIALEQLDALSNVRHSELLEPFLAAANTDLQVGDFASARVRLRSCYAMAVRLKGAERQAAQLAIQSDHLLLSWQTGDSQEGISLCDAAFNGRALRAPPLARSRYLGQVSSYLSHLGLLKHAVALADHMQQHCHVKDPALDMEVKMRAHHERVSALVLSLGVGVRILGPLGWDRLPADDTRRQFARALAAQAADLERARQYGNSALVRAAELYQRLYNTDASGSERARDDLLSEAKANEAKAGVRFEDWGWAMLLTSSQIRAGRIDVAAHTLQELQRQNPARAVSLPWGEEWQYQMHLCLQDHGQARGALDAYKEYARLVDQRTVVARQLLARWCRPDHAAWLQGIQDLRVGAGDVASRVDPDLLRQTLERCKGKVHSVAELAARFGVTPRRLQQIFKANGIPSPSRWIRSEPGMAATPRPSGRGR